MSKDAKNVPALRFKGYSDAWEKRKLGEVLFERNSRSGAKQLLSVTINQGVIKAEDSGRKDNSSSDLSNYKLVKVGDIPYNSMRMWQGASGYSYFEGIVSPAYTVLIPSAETDGLFLSYDIKRNKMLSVFQRHSQGLTSDTWNLKYPQLSSIHVRVPKKNEQKQIRQALIKLDDLIAATQRRIDALEQAKKALLQRLFDQSWRFKGYSDPWEKRKFKDLVVRINKTSDDSMIPSVEFEDIISKQGRLNKDVRLKINSKQGIYFEPQDVLFGKLRPYLQNWLFPSFYGRAVGDFWVLRANSSLLSEYLFVLIQSPRFQSVANISAGTKMPRSDWNTVSNTSFSIPVQSEQRRIGQLFNVLDDLIAATQSRLSSLELLKKALLQDLFI